MAGAGKEKGSLLHQQQNCCRSVLYQMPFSPTKTNTIGMSDTVCVLLSAMRSLNGSHAALHHALPHLLYQQWTQLCQKHMHNHIALSQELKGNGTCCPIKVAQAMLSRHPTSICSFIIICHVQNRASFSFNNNHPVRFSKIFFHAFNISVPLLN